MNNFQPRIAVAWSPNFQSGPFAKFFGKHGESVIRGGFGITNDYYGEQLAVTFDLNNALGFSLQSKHQRKYLQHSGYLRFWGTSASGALFTGFGQAIRPLPGHHTPRN